MNGLSPKWSRDHQRKNIFINSFRITENAHFGGFSPIVRQNPLWGKKNLLATCANLFIQQPSEPKRRWIFWSFAPFWLLLWLVLQWDTNKFNPVKFWPMKLTLFQTFLLWMLSIQLIWNQCAQRKNLHEVVKWLLFILKRSKRQKWCFGSMNQLKLY